MMKRKLKILIAEDNPVDALLITHTLETELTATEITRADCSPSFDEALNNNEFDIILCDHFMNDMTSLDALDRVKKLNDDIPFIVVTSHKDNDLARKVVGAGAYDYVLKSDLFRLPTAIKNAVSFFSIKHEIKELRKRLPKE